MAVTFADLNTDEQIEFVQSRMMRDNLVMNVLCRLKDAITPEEKSALLAKAKVEIGKPVNPADFKQST